MGRAHRHGKRRRTRPARSVPPPRRVPPPRFGHPDFFLAATAALVLSPLLAPPPVRPFMADTALCIRVVGMLMALTGSVLGLIRWPALSRTQRTIQVALWLASALLLAIIGATLTISTA